MILGCVKDYANTADLEDSVDGIEKGNFIGLHHFDY